jgi:hypothetical protein
MKDRTGFIKCNSCKCYRLEETYKTEYGKIYKSCFKCRREGLKYYKYNKKDRTGFIRCARCACFRTPDDFKDDQRDYKSCCKCRLLSRNHMAKKLKI